MAEKGRTTFIICTGCINDITAKVGITDESTKEDMEKITTCPLCGSKKLNMVKYEEPISKLHQSNILTGLGVGIWT